MDNRYSTLIYSSIYLNYAKFIILYVMYVKIVNRILQYYNLK